MKYIFLISMLFVSLSAWAQENSTLEIANSPLYKKTIYVIGDSYVRNHKRPFTETWHYKVAQKYQMNYQNFGRNGNCIAFDRTDRGFGKPMYTRYVEMPDSADYVIVIAGHNDAGMIDSTHTLADFKEKLGIFCEGLIAKYPTAKLAFFSPWNVRRDNFPEIIAAMEEVCGNYSIPVYNAAKNSGIYVWDESFRKRFFQSGNDTAHLNDAGHNLFLNKAEHFLLGL